MGKALKIKKRFRKNHSNQVKAKKRVEATMKTIKKLQQEYAANPLHRIN